MSIDLEGRAGLVTRAAGGIGRASAIAFGRAGASVIVADLESAREGGEETVEADDFRGPSAAVAGSEATFLTYSRRPSAAPGRPAPGAR